MVDVATVLAMAEAVQAVAAASILLLLLVKLIDNDTIAGFFCL